MKSRSRSRSVTPRRRDRDRDRERERDRVRERERDRDRDRDDRDRDRDDRDRDRDRRRKRDRSRERHRKSPERNRRRSRSRSRSHSRGAKDRRSNMRVNERPRITEADLEGKSPEEQEMMKVMGFCGFDTTKGKKVHGNNAGEVHVILKRKYRQYMNRKGGFNRPLDFVA
uniref:U4/U6.U5 small nuclear ribonucleoprotein 27 kDa protein n=1 Tax=Xenopsylla cheopis TaxID=163159 RepID=A0A6M2DH53_XENCH